MDRRHRHHLRPTQRQAQQRVLPIALDQQQLARGRGPVPRDRRRHHPWAAVHRHPDAMPVTYWTNATNTTTSSGYALYDRTCTTCRNTEPSIPRLVHEQHGGPRRRLGQGHQPLPLDSQPPPFVAARAGRQGPRRNVRPSADPDGSEQSAAGLHRGSGPRREPPFGGPTSRATTFTPHGSTSMVTGRCAPGRIHEQVRRDRPGGRDRKRTRRRRTKDGRSCNSSAGLWFTSLECFSGRNEHGTANAYDPVR